MSDGDLSKQVGFDSFVEANFRRNFLANILDMALFKLAMNIVSPAIILPLLMSHLTDSRLAIGLIPALNSLGYQLPQLFAANYAERLPHKKRFVFILGVVERIPFPLIALAIFALAGPLPGLAAVVFLSARALGAMAGGMATPAWYDIISKVIPLRKRGVYAGAGNALGSVLSIAGGGLAGWILVTWPYPTNFALCYVAATVACSLSLLSFSATREPAALSVKVAVPMTAYLSKLPAVLRRDANYARYLISRALTIAGGMAGGFYVVYGAESFGMAEAEAGILTMVYVGSQAVFNLLLGPLGDRHGHKWLLVLDAACTLLAALVAYFAVSSIWLWGTFALLGVGMACTAVSGTNIIVEFCRPEDRPTYVGLSNTIYAPVGICAPLIGGWLASVAGFQGLFLAAALLAGLSAVLMLLWVKEPREREPKFDQPGIAVLGSE